MCEHYDLTTGMWKKSDRSQKSEIKKLEIWWLARVRAQMWRERLWKVVARTRASAVTKLAHTEYLARVRAKWKYAAVARTRTSEIKHEKYSSHA